MRTRPAAVAGRFYPGEASRLRAAVDTYLRAPTPVTATPPAELRAVVAPHAGYVYSGPTAGVAYRLLPSHAGRWRRLLVLGPAHYVPVRGVALTSADAWSTPLGEVAVDVDTVAALLARGGPAEVDDEAHAPEHSLEVQVPFLQVVAPGVAIVPMLVGTGDSHAVADLLDPWWRDPQTLVVVSTDLSHYQPVEVARRLDTATAAAVCRADADAVGDHDACGCRPLRAVLRLAARDGVPVTLLDLRTSADTAGDPDRVVGYGAFAMGA